MTKYPTEYSPEDLTLWILEGNRFEDIIVDRAYHYLWLTHALPEMHECVTIMPNTKPGNYIINVAGQFYTNLHGKSWTEFQTSLPRPVKYYLKKD